MFVGYMRQSSRVENAPHQYAERSFEYIASPKPGPASRKPGQVPGVIIGSYSVEQGRPVNDAGGCARHIAAPQHIQRVIHRDQLR